MKPSTHRERNPHPGPARRAGGWTFVELLVAIALSAVFLGAASLVYSSISANSKRLTQTVSVEIGSETRQNFYGQHGILLGINFSDLLNSS